MTDELTVEIVYATRDRQWLETVCLPRGSSAADAVEASGLEIVYRQNEKVDGDISLGIYSQPVSADHLLRDGDRVELYRPLKIDSKDVRRQLARAGKAMGQAVDPSAD